MAGFNPLNRGGLVLLPTKGAAGATGAAGSGSVFQSVDALSGTPRSVTDWGAIINTALTAGTRHFIFGPFDYPFTTMIDGRQLQGIYFQGAAGFDWYDAGRTDGLGKETGHTRLIWNGTGSGFAMDFSSTTTGPNGNVGFSIRDMMVMYSSASYTGKLLNTKNSGFAVIDGCWFGSSTSTRQTAAAAISLDGVNTIDIAHTTFDNSFLSAIRGRESGGAGYSNVVRFHECTFNGGVNAAITNPGLDWVFDHCDFEFPSHAASKPMVTTDFTYTGDQIQMTLRDCTWWDATGGTQKGVYAPAGNVWNFAALNCHDHNTAAALAKLYEFACNGSVVIEGGDALNVIDVGDGGVAGSKKSIVRIVGVDIYSGSTTTGLLLNVNTAHASVEVDNLATKYQNGLGVSGQIRTLGHERVQYVDQSSIAAHAGVTNQSQGIYGNDATGFILITNSGGVTGPTGLLADITITAPGASTDAGAGVSTGRELPLVAVFPFKPDDGGANFATPNMATTYACQPYAYAKTIRNAGSQASWSVGVNVGIPAGGTIAVGYRVVHL